MNKADYYMFRAASKRLGLFHTSVDKVIQWIEALPEPGNASAAEYAGTIHMDSYTVAYHLPKKFALRTLFKTKEEADAFNVWWTLHGKATNACKVMALATPGWSLLPNPTIYYMDLIYT